MNVRVACAIVLLAITAACMPHLPPQAEAVPKPASQAAQSRSFFFEGVTDGDLQDVSIIVAAGLACYPQSSSPNLPGMQRLVPSDPAFAHIFREELSRAGYRNIGVAGEAGASPAAADYRIVALLTRTTMNICYPYSSNLGDGNGQARALEGASEAQLITGMGRPPDNVVPLQSGARILQWRRSENVYQSGTPGQVMVVANTAYYLPGARPKVEHEFCLINWTVTNGVATQYHWQGDCRSLQNKPGG